MNCYVGALQSTLVSWNGLLHSFPLKFFFILIHNFSLLRPFKKKILSLFQKINSSASSSTHTVSIIFKFLESYHQRYTVIVSLNLCVLGFHNIWTECHCYYVTITKTCLMPGIIHKYPPHPERTTSVPLLLSSHLAQCLALRSSYINKVFYAWMNP